MSKCCTCIGMESLRVVGDTNKSITLKSWFREGCSSLPKPILLWNKHQKQHVNGCKRRGQTFFEKNLSIWQEKHCFGLQQTRWHINWNIVLVPTNWTSVLLVLEFFSPVLCFITWCNKIVCFGRLSVLWFVLDVTLSLLYFAECDPAVNCPHVSRTLHRCLSQVLKVETIWEKPTDCSLIFSVRVLIIMTHLRWILQLLFAWCKFDLKLLAWCIKSTYAGLSLIRINYVKNKSNTFQRKEKKCKMVYFHWF